MKLLPCFLTTLNALPAGTWFSSYCDLIPCSTSSTQQVCGTDGVTYDNPCDLIRSSCRQGTLGQTAQAHLGACVIIEPTPPPTCNKLCPMMFDPICATNNQTYSNQCALENATCDDPTILSKHKGECQKDTLPCVDCPYNIMPEEVCGSDGQTYPSLCWMQSENCGKPISEEITMLHKGQCERRMPCPMCMQQYGNQPVCASDGNTYDSDCMLATANCDKPISEEIKKLHDGPCPRIIEPCPLCMVHPKYMRPVCDNITYDSQCTLDTYNCNNNRNVQVKHQGECKMPTPPPLPCPNCAEYYQPVCGSDGKTYSNDCFLMGSNCNRPFDEAIVTKRHEGECKSKPTCSDFCTRQYDPVCGTDGVTYNNKCLLQQAACKSLRQETLTVRHDGSCQMWGGFGDFFQLG